MSGQPMSGYLLAAKSADGSGDAVGIDASDDSEATVLAVLEVLERAYEDQSGPWAKGEVTLSRPDGSVLRVMYPKF